MPPCTPNSGRSENHTGSARAKAADAHTPRAQSPPRRATLHRSISLSYDESAPAPGVLLPTLLLQRALHGRSPGDVLLEGTERARRGRSQLYNRALELVGLLLGAFPGDLLGRKGALQELQIGIYGPPDRRLRT